jgi:prevent-host-death family protein
MPIVVRSIIGTIRKVQHQEGSVAEAVVEEQVSIGRVKRDISELVNRVAYGKERVVLTSRGKPKAALVSMADYAHLRELEEGEARAQRLAKLEEWFKQVDELNAQILARRGGVPVDVDRSLREAKADLEHRGDWLSGFDEPDH